MNCIQQLNIQPRWNEIALPNGRSVTSCQRAFSQLLSQVSADYPAAARPVAVSPAPVRPRKRPPVGETSLPLQTAPGAFSSFASVNDPSTPHAPTTTTQSPGGKVPKKRGRPSKAEAEIRAAEAAERGEIYPRPKKVKAKPPTEGSTVSLPAFTAASGEADDPSIGEDPPPTSASGGPASKKRMPKPKATKEVRTNLEATASAASALDGHGEASGTQNLLAGIQEHAASSEPSTTGRTSLPIAISQPEQIPTSREPPTSNTETEPYKTPYQ
ncbi:MAG: hypothetical protein Q9191_003989 [Dirinaria sp. TL-2023a]